MVGASVSMLASFRGEGAQSSIHADASPNFQEQNGLSRANLPVVFSEKCPRAPAAAPAPWRRPATARSVIFLFMEGGPSHIDTFDPKPEVNRLAGRPLPPSFKPVITPMGEGRSPLLASQRTWAQHGQSGIWVSDCLPHLATCAD